MVGLSTRTDTGFYLVLVCQTCRCTVNAYSKIILKVCWPDDGSEITGCQVTLSRSGRCPSCRLLKNPSTFPHRHSRHDQSHIVHRRGGLCWSENMHGLLQQSLMYEHKLPKIGPGTDAISTQRTSHVGHVGCSHERSKLHLQQVTFLFCFLKIFLQCISI